MNDSGPHFFTGQSASPPDDAPAALLQDQTEFNVIFVHSRLDDYGLSAAMFRVYCHLARRAGKGEAYPSVKTIAEVCRLHPDTVRAALRTLTAHQLLTREDRPGTTSLYRLTPASRWQPPTHINCNPSETNTPPSLSESTQAKKRNACPPETKGAKGNPLEGNPGKAIHSPLPPSGERADNQSTPALSQAEIIYDAYPKQVGKPTALRAIRKAIAKVGFEFLLERTRVFAATYNGEPQFIPYPSKWFRQEHFIDDPATWRRTIAGKPQPKVIRPVDFTSAVGKLT